MKAPSNIDVPAHRNAAVIVALLCVPFGFAIHADGNRSEPMTDEELLEAMLAESAYDEDWDLAGSDFDYGELDSLDDSFLEDEDEDRPSHMPTSFFEAVIFGDSSNKGPGFYGPFSAFTPYMSRDELEKALPEYEKWEYEGLPGHDYVDVSWRNDFFADNVYVSGLSLSFPDDGSALRILSSRWGDPKLREDEYFNLERIWQNQKNRVMAILTVDEYDDDAELNYVRYQTLADLIPASGPLFGMETSDLLGSDLDTAEDKTHLYHLVEAGISPGLDFYGARGDEDKVGAMELSFDLDSEESVATLESLLRQKYGRPKKVENDDEYGRTLKYSKYGRDIEMYISDGEVFLEIRPKGSETYAF